MRCYVLGDTLSEDLFINGMRLWVIYFLGTPLLVGLYISKTTYMAGGHRCSLRHNVCRPATMRMRIYTIVKFISAENICTLHF